jgi:hypothetical protein
MSLNRPCVDFRRGTKRPSWVPPIASGRFAGLEIADRQATRKATQSVQRASTLDRRTADAREWALRVGFSEDEALKAAAAALFLRGMHGDGNVTAPMVARLMGKQ